MSRCERARELLWPLDRPRAVDPEVREARAHLEECAECRAFFARDATLTRALRRTSIEAEASDALRERILDAIRAESSRSAGPGIVRRAARWVVAAAAVVAVAFGLSRLGLGVAPAEASYIADYRSHLDESVPAGGIDLEKTYEFFLEEFGLPVAPVAYDVGEANRAMICLIAGRHVATVEYEIDGHKVAHYRVPLERVDREIDLTTAAQDDLRIVRWSDDDFEHALVSDMDERRLLEIARERFSATH